MSLLVETWVAVPLRTKSEIQRPSGWFEGATNWLLEGSSEVTLIEPLLGAGGAGARLHAILKEIDPQSRVVLGDGALEPFEHTGVEEPKPELAALPEPWQTGLVEGTSRATLRAEGLLATVTGRYAGRTRREVPALRLVVRGVREDLLPNEGSDPGYGRDLVAALKRPGACRDLRDLLAHAGSALGRRLCEGFTDAVEAPCELRTKVWLFERVDGLEELLRGLPDSAQRHLGAVGAWFALARPTIEVTRRNKNGQIELWRGESDEVLHVG